MSGSGWRSAHVYGQSDSEKLFRTGKFPPKVEVSRACFGSAPREMSRVEKMHEETGFAVAGYNRDEFFRPGRHRSAVCREKYCRRHA